MRRLKAMKAAASFCREDPGGRERHHVGQGKKQNRCPHLRGDISRMVQNVGSLVGQSGCTVSCLKIILLGSLMAQWFCNASISALILALIWGESGVDSRPWDWFVAR